jgi:hypothetical protein
MQSKKQKPDLPEGMLIRIVVANRHSVNDVPKRELPGDEVGSWLHSAVFGGFIPWYPATSFSQSSFRREERGLLPSPGLRGAGGHFVGNRRRLAGLDGE